MTGWKIDVEGVRSVLVAVASAGEGLSLCERDIRDLTADVATTFARTSRIGEAIDGLLHARRDDVFLADSRAHRVAEAVSSAVAAYLAADESMGASTRAAAAAGAGGR